MTPPPPDRADILTEHRHPGSMDLHQRSVAQLVELFNREDRAVPDALDAARPALTAFLEAAEPRWLAGGRLIYLGAGTSGRLGVLDASECPPTFQSPPGRVVGLIAGGDPALRRSSEGMEDDPRGAEPELAALNLTEHDILIGIAAGGTTPYVRGALFWARSPSPKEGAGGWNDALEGPHPSSTPPLTALITCSPVPPSAADHILFLPTGPEVLTGSTRMKAGTATKLALNIISTTLMIREGRVYENLMIDLRATNDKLKDRAARVVAALTGLPRTDSFKLLDHAGGSAKMAVVMHRFSLTESAAKVHLAACCDRLSAALSIHPSP